MAQKPSSPLPAHTEREGRDNPSVSSSFKAFPFSDTCFRATDWLMVWIRCGRFRRPKYEVCGLTLCPGTLLIHRLDQQWNERLPCVHYWTLVHFCSEVKQWIIYIYIYIIYIYNLDITINKHNKEIIANLIYHLKMHRYKYNLVSVHYDLP